MNSNGCYFKFGLHFTFAVSFSQVSWVSHSFHLEEDLAPPLHHHHSLIFFSRLKPAPYIVFPPWTFLSPAGAMRVPILPLSCLHGLPSQSNSQHRLSQHTSSDPQHWSNGSKIHEETISFSCMSTIFNAFFKPHSPLNFRANSSLLPALSRCGWFPYSLRWRELSCWPSDAVVVFIYSSIS